LLRLGKSSRSAYKLLDPETWLNSPTSFKTTRLYALLKLLDFAVVWQTQNTRVLPISPSIAAD